MDKEALAVNVAVVMEEEAVRTVRLVVGDLYLQYLYCIGGHPPSRFKKALSCSKQTCFNNPIVINQSMNHFGKFGYLEIVDLE